MAKRSVCHLRAGDSAYNHNPKPNPTHPTLLTQTLFERLAKNSTRDNWCERRLVAPSAGPYTLQARAEDTIATGKCPDKQAGSVRVSWLQLVARIDTKFSQSSRDLCYSSAGSSSHCGLAC